MTHEQKQQIEAAIYNLKMRVGDCFTKGSTEENLNKVLAAQNALYDAIGGMDDHKFDLN